MNNKLENHLFDIRISPVTGAVEELRLKADPDMNFVLNSRENPWHADSFSWGLGNLSYGWATRFPPRFLYQKPAELECDGLSMRALYDLQVLRLEVKRCFLPSGHFREKYELRNPSSENIPIEDFFIHIPFFPPDIMRLRTEISPRFMR